MRIWRSNRLKRNRGRNKVCVNGGTGRPCRLATIGRAMRRGFSATRLAALPSGGNNKRVFCKRGAGGVSFNAARADVFGAVTGRGGELVLVLSRGELIALCSDWNMKSS